MTLAKKMATAVILLTICISLGYVAYRSNEKGIFYQLRTKGVTNTVTEEVVRQKDLKMSILGKTENAVSYNMKDLFIHTAKGGTLNSRIELSEQWLRENDFLIKQSQEVGTKKFSTIPKIPPVGTVLNIYEYYYSTDENHFEGTKVSTQTQVAMLRANIRASSHDSQNKSVYLKNATLIADSIIQNTFSIDVYGKNILAISPSMSFFKDKNAWDKDTSQVYAAQVFEVAELFAKLYSISKNDVYKTKAEELLSGQMHVQDNMPEKLLSYGVAYDKELNKYVPVRVFPLSVYRYACGAYEAMCDTTKDKTYANKLSVLREGFNKVLDQCDKSNTLYNGLRQTETNTLEVVNFDEFQEVWDVDNESNYKMIIDTAVANYFLNKEILSNKSYAKVQKSAEEIADKIFIGAGYKELNKENFDMSLYVSNSEADIILQKKDSDKTRDYLSCLINNENKTKDINGIGASSRFFEKPVIDADITCTIYSALVR